MTSLPTNATTTAPEFGRIWFDLLNSGPISEDPGSLLTGETVLPDGRTAALAAVVPAPNSPFPRARQGEVGLRESLSLASWVASLDNPDKPLVLIIDVPSQAYGYVEELFGLNTTMATSVQAIASARLADRPVVSLVVGKAISGAFLSTGLQANRIVMLDHDGVQVQVMGKQAAARITRRTVDEMEKIAETFPATAFDGASFTTLGAVFETVVPKSAGSPGDEDSASALAAVGRAVDDILNSSGSDLRCRVESEAARTARAQSLLVRDAVNAQW